MAKNVPKNWSIKSKEKQAKQRERVPIGWECAPIEGRRAHEKLQERKDLERETKEIWEQN